jgi:hypothetical protein
MPKYFVEHLVTTSKITEVEAKDEKEAYEFAIENYLGKWIHSIDREMYVVDGVVVSDSLD